MRIDNKKSVMADYALKELTEINNSLIVKLDYLADKYETLEIAKEADLFLCALEGIDNFWSYPKYPLEILEKAGIPEDIIHDCMSDKSNVPAYLRKNVLYYMRLSILDNYVEKNDYYRMLNGQPPINDENSDYVYITEVVNGVDTSKPLHLMSKDEISILNALGILDLEIEKNPEKKYLRYLIETKRVPVPIARKANPYQILKIKIDRQKQPLYYLFISLYNEAKNYVMNKLYDEAYEKTNDYYKAFIGMFILSIANQRFISNQIKLFINRDFYDKDLIKLMFESYGIPFYNDINLNYLQKVVKNLNRLLRYKATDKVFTDIFKIFDIKNFKINQYFLLKDRKYDINNKPVFAYKRTVDNANVIETDTSYLFNNDFYLKALNKTHKHMEGLTYDVSLNNIKEILFNKDGSTVYYLLNNGVIMVAGDKSLFPKGRGQHNHYPEELNNIRTMKYDEKSDTIYFISYNGKCFLASKTIDATIEKTSKGTSLIEQDLLHTSIKDIIIDGDNYIILGYNNTIRYRLKIQDIELSGERAFQNIHSIALGFDKLAVVLENGLVNVLGYNGSRSLGIDVDASNLIKDFIVIPEVYKTDLIYFFDKEFTFIISQDTSIKILGMCPESIKGLPEWNLGIKHLPINALDIKCVRYNNRCEFLFIGNKYLIGTDNYKILTYLNKLDATEYIPGYVRFDNVLNPFNILLLKDGIVINAFKNKGNLKLIGDNKYGELVDSKLEINTIHDYSKDDCTNILILDHTTLILNKDGNLSMFGKHKDYSIPQKFYSSYIVNMYKNDNYVHLITNDGDMLVTNFIESHEILKEDYTLISYPYIIKENKLYKEDKLVYDKDNVINFCVTDDNIIIINDKLEFKFINDDDIIYKLSNNDSSFNIIKSIMYVKDFIYCLTFDGDVIKIAKDKTYAIITSKDLEGDEYFKIPEKIKYMQSDENDIVFITVFDNVLVLNGFKKMEMFEIFQDDEDFKIVNFDQYLSNIAMTETDIAILEKYSDAVMFKEDVRKMYDIKFVELESDEKNLSRELANEENYLDYELVVNEDKLWGDDENREEFLEKILENEFNYARTKYISVNSIYELTELNFELCYLFRMMIDLKDNEKYLQLEVPFVGKCNLFDTIVALFSLTCFKLGFDGNIMDTNTKTMSVLGFNYNVDYQYIEKIIDEAGLSEKNADFEIEKINIVQPAKVFSSPKEIVNNYLVNKDNHDTLFKYKYESKTIEEFNAYKRIYNASFITKYNTDMYRINGVLPKTYLEYLKIHNEKLYKFIKETKKENIVEQIDSILMALEQYMKTDELQHVFLNIPSLSVDTIKRFLYFLIEVFKSYTVDLKAMAILYHIDNKYIHCIKLILSEDNFYKSWNDDERLIFMDKLYDALGSFEETEFLLLLKKIIKEGTIGFEERLQLVRSFLTFPTACEDILDSCLTDFFDDADFTGHIMYKLKILLKEKNIPLGEMEYRLKILIDDSIKHFHKFAKEELLETLNTDFDDDMDFYKKFETDERIKLLIKYKFQGLMEKKLKIMKETYFKDVDEKMFIEIRRMLCTDFSDDIDMTTILTTDKDFVLNIKQFYWLMTNNTIKQKVLKKTRYKDLILSLSQTMNDNMLTDFLDDIDMVKSDSNNVSLKLKSKHFFTNRMKQQLLEIKVKDMISHNSFRKLEDYFRIEFNDEIKENKSAIKKEKLKLKESVYFIRNS